ncbi:TPA: HIT family protein [Candidatus Dependentiae bacterium]|nr:MAG: Asymmetrical Bis(5'-nucleosyl)-tetraphosphatase [candidate division TM6 bacterium GW2011_GWE2_31_21]KKP53757.1 MAG: Asymmetrical Bis(5'-nucleosyl)-tetraphosphatase [candidate division TM6 bacterium GW2011_GWF2_33_332]HBS48489.1 HIT family protein [Candidatus Dependentiae bacterium]HBZ73104.1 HIT family protein [Candidatus Dependentiae bacterium]
MLKVLKNKKFLGLLLFTAIFGYAVYFVQKSANSAEIFAKQREHCPFCNSKRMEWQKIYEDDLVFASLNYKPLTQGHCLVIPKRHVERSEDLTDEETLRIFQVIKKVHKAAENVFGVYSFRIVQNNGLEVGQSVTHVHYHYIPRKKDEKYSWYFAFKCFFESYPQKPLTPEQMKEPVEKMRLATEKLK